VLVLEAENLHKTYLGLSAPIEALKGVSLDLESGEFVAVMGPSGCGKSTLLHLCGAMDRPTLGSLLIEGQAIQDLSDDRLTRLRRTRIGFVFQFFNLLPTLNLLENVSLPLLLDGVDGQQSDQQARRLLQQVGLADRLNHYPQQLSGGEMQRAAIARAVIHRPALLIADEPTGNLDSESGTNILALLAELNKETNVSILLATHSMEAASAADRVFHMKDGIVQRIQLKESMAR
jgi:putative ABC transport system ATP-binding protein